MRKISVKDILVPTLSLFLICLIVSIALSATNALTKDTIQKNDEATKENSMKSVCSDAETFEEIVPDVAYRAIDKNGNDCGYAISTSCSGYGGMISVMTGISNDGKIMKIDVYDNDEETPGLGKNTSNSDFTGQFSGLDTGSEIVVSKDYSGSGEQVDAVTSATISSRAVVSAVNAACDIYSGIVTGGEQ